MYRFNVISDIHSEYIEKSSREIWENSGLWKCGDNLILAGDIGTLYSFKHFKKPKAPFLEEMLSSIRPFYRNIFYIPGHTELRGPLLISQSEEVLQNLCEKYNITYLNNSAIEFGDINIIGSILFTKQQSTNIEKLKETNDYMGIPFYYRESQKRHKESIKAIKKCYRKNKQNIIITHDAPLLGLHNPFKNFDFAINSLYESDLSETVKGFKGIWISGRTHYSMMFRYNNMQMFSNQYVGGVEKTRYSSNFILNVDKDKIEITDISNKTNFKKRFCSDYKVFRSINAKYGVVV